MANEIEKRFTYHPPKEGQPEKYTHIRNLARDLAYTIDQLCPDSREKSLALTKLEESVMWANAAIARNK
jgi:queuine/archaeosine tRNA-ribosyltransferase